MNFVDASVYEAFRDADRYFPTALQKLQFFDKYSRWNEQEGRRETWKETVKRTVDFLRELSNNKLPEQDYLDIEQAILEMKVMPSMRSLAMAGDAARRQNLAIYNCSALPFEDFDAPVEALLISMSGCGVGYSVERQFVEKLPIITPYDGSHADLWVVEDTTEGWAEAVRFGLQTWVSGKDVRFDYRLVRPAGAILRVKGGQASGPEPLQNLLTFARSTIQAAAGRRLTSLECHDLMCNVGSAAVSGGVRRTAMIALFDFDDELMLHCKDGDFPNYRWNANNSAVWPRERLTQPQVYNFFQSMVDGGRGEPGIFNRRAIDLTKPERREDYDTWLVNPCGEIVLRKYGLCNLTSIIARVDDSIASLLEKARLATIIGTIQSMATNFPGLRPEWKENAEKERLLGVSLDGQMDSPAAQNPLFQGLLREQCIKVNREYAALLEINQSASITCVKPSGNSSQLLDCSSGIHVRWSPFYVRNIRISPHSPIYKVLRDSGVPMDPEDGQTAENANTWVVHFPVAAPRGAITRNSRTAIEQCNYWLQVKTNYTEHNPSITITYQPHEVEDIKEWLYLNQERVGGMAFLPAYNAGYGQLPYEEIDEQTYLDLVEAFPADVDFSRIVLYEQRDETTAAQELACMSGLCELV